LTEIEFVKQFALAVYILLVAIAWPVMLACVFNKNTLALVGWFYGMLGWGTAAVLILRGIVQ